jgi:AcrR family transcriptional regulator
LAKVSDAHLEARRRSILDAATRVFSEKGVELATMAEVAAEAGISPGAIYRYFENKDELARGCMSESSDAIEEAWERLPNPGTASPMDDFGELARLTFAKLNSPASRTDTKLSLEQILLMARDEGSPVTKEFGKNFLSVIDGIEARLKLAQEHGQLRKDIDTRTVAGALYSFYWGARLTRLVQPSTDTDGQLEALIRLMEAAKPTKQ